MKILPFWLTFKGLMLSGSDREKAKAYYTLEGEALDRALLAIDYSTDDMKQLNEYKLKKLEIDRKYNKINDCDYECELNRLNFNGKDENTLKINELDILHKYHKIEDAEYYKQRNDILGKSWVAIHTDESAGDSDNLEIEVTYNKTFIKQMRARGIPGDTDDEVAEQWLKLFVIANLDEDDLSMVEPSDDKEELPTSVTQIDSKRKFIG